jgi:serine/threonine protein phosphatase PrpC
MGPSTPVVLTPAPPVIQVANAIGMRPYQEDTYFVKELEVGTLLGVFDGHGGEACSYECAESFPTLFEKKIKKNQTPAQWLRAAFALMNRKTELLLDGSAASVVFIPKSKELAVIAILGDSPVIVGTSKGFHVSPEHNARTNPKERDAAIARGAIYFGGYLRDELSGQGLQMSRSFGDANLGSFLNRKPQIYQKPIHDFVLLATDGAFDPGHTNAAGVIQQVVDLIRNGATAQQLVNRAVNAPTGDNVTCILWRK